MRVFKIPESIERPSAALPEPAKLSLRAVTLLEVASVVFTVLITAWVIMPLRLGNWWMESLPGLLALLMMFNSHRLRGETPRQLGFTPEHFGRACRLLIGPMIVALAIVLLIGRALGSLHFTAHFPASFFGRAAWGLVQQYILQAFIFRRLRSALTSEGEAETQPSLRLPILTTALLFALVHAPNLPLMLLTFASALLWTRVYSRAPNLPALALSHGLLSAVTAMSLPDWMLRGMIVGLRHLVYQAF
ncbi:MAG TPA: CPBP family glutamic-type intramembrane protease [Blastocatellia bacterium]|nr:CPBP family glutamic-type intramembrane protease [Blastocatellia bacterium]